MKPVPFLSFLRIFGISKQLLQLSVAPAFHNSEGQTQAEWSFCECLKPSAPFHSGCHPDFTDWPSRVPGQSLLVT